jgi:hypothetical protein
MRANGLMTLAVPRRLVGEASLRWTCAFGWLVFGLAVASGVAASGNPTWWRLSICALGMAASPAPWAFDVGVLAVAGIFALLAIRARSTLAPCVHRGTLTAGQVRAVTGAVVLVAGSLAVLALVPYDVGPFEKMIHNAAGWGSGWVVAASMALVPWRLRIFDRRFYAQTWVALVVFMFAFFGFEAGLLTYAQAEIAAICVAAFWSTVLFARLEMINSLPRDSRSCPSASVR